MMLKRIYKVVIIQTKFFKMMILKLFKKKLKFYKKVIYNKNKINIYLFKFTKIYSKCQ